MSESESPKPSLLERLEGLRVEGEELALSLRTRQKEVEEELAKYITPNPVTVRVALAENGLIEGLEVESPSVDVEPGDYLEAINTAILLAQAQAPTLSTEATRALLDAALNSVDPPSEKVTNDLNEVTVVAVFGDIRAVEAKPSWLQAASDRTIASEVLRIAQQAAQKSDQFGRFSLGGNNG